MQVIIDLNQICKCFSYVCPNTGLLVNSKKRKAEEAVIKNLVEPWKRLDNLRFLIQIVFYFDMKIFHYDPLDTKQWIVSKRIIYSKSFVLWNYETLKL